MYSSQKMFNFTFRRWRASINKLSIIAPATPRLYFTPPHPPCDIPRLSGLSGARVYERVKRMREDERRKRTMLCDVLQYINDGRACQQWLSKQAAM